MSATMPVRISHEPADPCWGPEALVSFSANQATIHLSGRHPIGGIQRAARKLSGQGIHSVALQGEGWDLEKQWAFSQGFQNAKGTQTVAWAPLPKADQHEFLARRQAVEWTREAVNGSAEEVFPEELATRAGRFLSSLAPEAISYRVVVGEQLQVDGWTGLYQVGRGSERIPAMLQLDFNPSGNPAEPTVACVVGKGITFDSGGYSLKATNFMDAMKADMGGSGIAVGGVALAILRGLQRRLRVTLCCAENMVSGSAYKLGDILRYKNGKTVEVTNTDAEGRLVLADGLLHAAEYQPSLLIDCATLTGAAKVALGNDFHALMSFDDALAQRALKAAREEHEGLWRLPLAEFHRGMMPSPFADLANAASGQYLPGATMAAAFLSHFITDYKTGWLHFDCSGTYRKSASDQWAVGCTGMGVRTLARILVDESQRKTG